MDTHLTPEDAQAFKVGDLALHKNNRLDARPVAAVEGDMIRLQIGTIVAGPFPAANYHRISSPDDQAAAGGAR